MSGTPQDCFTAQTVPVVMRNGMVNPDIGGLVVKLAAIINNLLLSILLRWSNESYLEAVYGHYSQIFPILLSTVASIPKHGLSLFEGNLALVITASPISIYLSCLAFYRTYQDPRSVLKFADQTGEVFARWLGLMLPFLWWSLNFVVSFSTTAFRNSDLCRGMTLQMWIHHVITSSFVGIFDVMGAKDLYADYVSRGGLGTVSLVTLWIWSIYFIRHLNDIVDLYRERTETETTTQCRVPPIRWGLASLRFVRSSWDVIATTHSWLVTITICCFHWHWLLCVLKGTPIQSYDLSYGQILAAFSVFPAIVGITKLVAAHYRSRSAGKTVKRDIESKWHRARAGVAFFLVGNATLYGSRSTLTPTSTSSLPQYSSFLDLHESRTRLMYILFPLFSLLASTLHAGYITNYVIAGTLPNIKNFMNSNHSLWKPLSVTLYVSGFFIGCFNSFVWSYYPDLRRRILHVLKLNSSRYHEHLFTLVNILVIIPAAIFMSVGPLFSPYAALSLTQKHQWNYRCDSFPGEAILDGSTSSFTLRRTNPRGVPSGISYRLVQSAGQQWSLAKISPSNSLDLNIAPYQLPLQISYDGSAGSISATCGTQLCLQGNYSNQGKLSLELKTYQTPTLLETKENQWNYPNDAPSFIMQRLHPGDPRLLMETAVTKPNRCQVLKICLGDYPVNIDLFASLGVVQLAQNAYALFCTPPKLYSNPNFDNVTDYDARSTCSN